MKNKAFTLIELLVVIAIIAVLMGILMPSLRAARDQAKRMHCVSNVRTLTTAWIMYAGENDNKIVNGNVRTYSGSPTKDDWVFAADNGVSATLEEKQEAIRRGSLYPYVGKELNVYRCPSDLRIKDTTNECFRSFSIPAGANGEDGGWGDSKAKSLTDIKRHSEKYIFVEDIDPRGYNMGSWALKFNPIGWVDPLAIWHNGKSTLGFADGHAEMHKWSDPKFIDWCDEAIECQFNGKTLSFNLAANPEDMSDIRYMGRGYPCKNYKGSF